MRLFGKRIESFLGEELLWKRFEIEEWFIVSPMEETQKIHFPLPPLSLALSCFLTPSRSRSFALTHTLSLSCKQTAQAYVFAHTCIPRVHSHAPTPTNTQTDKKIPIVVAQSRTLSLICLVSFLLKLLFDFQLWCPEQVWIGCRLGWQFSQVPLYILNLILYTLYLQ